MKRAIAFVAALFLLTSLSFADHITVSAAVSLKEALTDAATDYQKQTGDRVDFNFAASGPLMTQIKNGADVDLFISAANKQVDDLTTAGLTVDGSRNIVARNSLVLIEPAKSDLPIKSFEDLKDDSVKKLAVGEPKTVPAGQYAQQVLKKLNLDSALADRLVYGASVRQVLQYVQDGAVSAGIVYSTDAKQAGDSVKVIATAKPDWHEPIVYPAVILQASKHKDTAKKFLEYLQSDKGQAVLTARGFAPANEPANEPATAPSK